MRSVAFAMRRLAASDAFGMFTGRLLPLGLAAAAFSLFVLSVFLAWIRYGRHIVSLADLLCAPWYSLRKLPLYAKFLVKRQSDWVRSRRARG